MTVPGLATSVSRFAVHGVAEKIAFDRHHRTNRHTHAHFRETPHLQFRCTQSQSGCGRRGWTRSGDITASPMNLSTRPPACETWNVAMRSNSEIRSGKSWGSIRFVRLL